MTKEDSSGGQEGRHPRERCGGFIHESHCSTASVAAKDSEEWSI